MRIVILCAGQGARLRPYTDDKPKCMVPLLGKPLIDHQIAAINACGDHEIYFVTGYAREALSGYGVAQFHNPDFATTNMVTSLFAAEALFDGEDDLIIAYADIVYEPRVLDALIGSSGAINTVIDHNWRALWRARMDDPLADAETLKLAADGQLLEIGKKPKDMQDIDGQYIGLTKVAREAQDDFCAFYHSLDKAANYDGQPFSNMYMTTFLQMLIDAGRPVHSTPIMNGWLEVDTPDDLRAYEDMHHDGRLAALWRPGTDQ